MSRVLFQIAYAQVGFAMHTWQRELRRPREARGAAEVGYAKEEKNMAQMAVFGVHSGKPT